MKKILLLLPLLALAPQTLFAACYDYAFVSRRSSGADNIFVANTCRPGLTAWTANSDSSTVLTGLQMNQVFPLVAFNKSKIEAGRAVRSQVAVIDGQNLSETVLDTNANNDEFDDYFAGTPAWGPSVELAFVSSEIYRPFWFPEIRVNEAFPSYDATASRIVLPYEGHNRRTINALTWIPARSTQDPGFGKIVVSMNNGDGADRLWVIDILSGELKPLVDPEHPEQGGILGFDPAVSHRNSADSPRRLAYIARENGEEVLKVCVLTLEETSEGLSCEDPSTISLGGNHKSPSWTHDDRKILYSVDRDYDARFRVNEEIYMINPDGTGDERLTNQTGPDRFPVCLPQMETRQARTTELKPAGMPNPVSIYREPARVLGAKQAAGRK